jgi:hypothetical protein
MTFGMKNERNKGREKKHKEIATATSYIFFTKLIVM